MSSKILGYFGKHLLSLHKKYQITESDQNKNDPLQAPGDGDNIRTKEERDSGGDLDEGCVSKKTENKREHQMKLFGRGLGLHVVCAFMSAENKRGAV